MRKVIATMLALEAAVVLHKDGLSLRASSPVSRAPVLTTSLYRSIRLCAPLRIIEAPYEPSAAR